MLRSLALKLGLRWVAGWIRDAAEGKHGPTFKALYWDLAGSKRYVGFWLAVQFAVLVALGESAAGAWISGTLAGLFLGVGWIDADWRTEVPAEIKSLRVYQFLIDRSADVSAALAAAALSVQACTEQTAALLARVHLTCHTAGVLLVILVAILTTAGLKIDAKVAIPPRR